MLLLVKLRTHDKSREEELSSLLWRQGDRVAKLLEAVDMVPLTWHWNGWGISLSMDSSYCA